MTKKEAGPVPDMVVSQQDQDQMKGRYALWFVPGTWWIVSLEEDETVIVPENRPPWPAPCLN